MNKKILSYWSERTIEEYLSPYIVILPEYDEWECKNKNMNTININYKDLNKLTVKDIEADSIYLIKTDFSEYRDVKTGKDLIRIITESNKLYKK